LADFGAGFGFVALAVGLLTLAGSPHRLNHDLSETLLQFQFDASGVSKRCGRQAVYLFLVGATVSAWRATRTVVPLLLRD